MCGIIGYKGEKRGISVSFKALKILEYRGYDSWGIAFKNRDKIEIQKQKGKLPDNIPFGLKEADICIGHTRWATHGFVTKENAHPHTSNNEKIAVVHNGIIENYQELKEFLFNKNFKFKTDTDTEIIPNLIQYFSNSLDYVDAVKKTLSILEGSYAVVIINQDSDLLIGAKNGSPLVLGIGKDENFLASDVPAFLENTNKVIYLDDNELVIIKDKPSIVNIKTGETIKKQPIEISWNLKEAKLEGFEHYMLKEIYEQPETIKKAIEQSTELINEATEMINNAFGVFLVACGTSYHSCLSASYLFAKLAKKHVNVILASEFRNFEHFLTDKTLVIAVSQSGETADLLDAVKFAKKHKCKTLSIVNVMGSSIMRECDKTILMNAGPEICVLSTKSYTSQLAIFTLIIYNLIGRLDEAKQKITSLSSNIKDFLDNNLNKIKEIAVKLKDSKDIFLIGRNSAYPTALEGALKIKEVSYIHAEGFAGGELKHGTIALIDNKIPVITLSTSSTKELIISNAMEVKSRGAYVIGIDSKNNQAYDEFIEVPDFEELNPIIEIIPLQLLSYYLALERGCNPDKPRNLAKSVTVR